MTKLSLTLGLSALLAACQPAAEEAKDAIQTTAVAASGESIAVGTKDADAADDPAIWRNPNDTALSLIIGTDKKAGIYVYGLDGKVRSFFPAGEVNNIDLRDNVMIDGKPAILVGVSNRNDRAVPHLTLYTLDPKSAKLTQITDAAVGKGEAYGFCFGTSAGAIPTAFVITKEGEAIEVRLSGKSANMVASIGTPARRVKTQPEGCVFDDRWQQLYIGEEDVGIWRFDYRQPNDSAIAFAKIEGKQLVADVEGLALAPTGDSDGYLVASSQGDNAYAVYRISDKKFMGRFKIDGGKIDGTYETDGIDLVLGDFGPDYPEGLFVAQDGDNGEGTQNFKYVSWKAIKDKLGLK